VYFINSNSIQIRNFITMLLSQL